MEKWKPLRASHFSTPPTATDLLTHPLRYTNNLAGSKHRARHKGQRYLGYHIPYDSGLSDREGVKMTESDLSTTQDHHRMVAVTKLDLLPDGTLRQIDPGRD